MGRQLTSIVIAISLAVIAVSVARWRPVRLAAGPSQLDVDRIESLLARRPLPGPSTRPTSQRAGAWDAVLHEVTFAGTPLHEAVDRLQKLTNGPMVVNWRALQEAGIEPMAPVTMSLRNCPASTALLAVFSPDRLRRTGVQCWIDGGGIAIIQQTQFTPKDVGVRVYNVRDLVLDRLRFDRAMRKISPPVSGNPAKRPPELTEDTTESLLINFIVENVDRESWVQNGGHRGVVGPWAGKLVIQQTRPNHAKIAALLEAMRND